MNVKSLALSLLLMGGFAQASEAKELSLDLGKRSGISVSVNAGRYGRGSRHDRIRRPVQIRPARSYCAPQRTWIPGHFETRTRRVFIPGTTEQVWVPPLYETRYDSCGNPYTVLVREGHTQTIRHPGHYETRRERIWIPGAWSVAPRPSYY